MSKSKKPRPNAKGKKVPSGLRSTPIRAGLKPSSVLRAHVADGLGAIAKSHRGLIAHELKPQLSDSLEIDENLKKGHENEHRWDYLLGHGPSQTFVGLEPHSASNHEITVVIKKRQNALEALRRHLTEGSKVAHWFWVASGKVDFVPVERQMLRCAQNGIEFVGRALRPGHFGT